MVFALDSATEECWWVIKPAHGTSEADTTRSNVNSGDKVRLEHQVTRKNLHSHPQANFKSPITRQQETTAYGSFGTGNDDDNWIIELLEGSKLEQGAKVILRHVSTGLVLHSHGDQAHKEYTDGEQEVTCLQRGDDNDVWQISEINISPERAVQPVISLSLDGRFGPFNFYSIDEFAKWFATEEATWSWLHHEAANPQLVARKEQLFNGLRNNLNEAASHRDSDNAKSLFDNVQSVASSVFKDSKWPVSGEPITKFINGILATRGKKVAAATLACLTGSEIAPGREIIEGAFTAFAYQTGISGISSSEIDALKEARAVIAKEAEAIHNEREALNKKAAELLGVLGSRSEQILESKSVELKQHIEEWDEAKKDAAKKLSDLEEAYRNKIAVESSVTYWKRKGRYNFALAAIFAISGGAVGIGLYQFLVDMSSTLLRLDKIGVHDYWRFAIILFTATVAIWVARLVVQLIFSNLHQWTDSRERQTMIQTYIALKKEGYLPEGKDATHILEVLFRPGDSGLLKGDRGPATPTEMVVKHFDRQGDS